MAGDGMRLSRQLPPVMRVVGVALAGPVLAAAAVLGGCGGPAASSSGPPANTATGAGSPPPAATPAPRSASARSASPQASPAPVKAEPYPAADWQYRLWYDFVLDVRAAHRLLGSGATLDRVIAPTAYAAWVYPGACYNKVGYWHLPGARVVYREHGIERSFGIASLISWRGVWYVVHLGAVQRTAATGIVDQPAAGPGVPGPPGGC